MLKICIVPSIIIIVMTTATTAATKRLPRAEVSDNGTAFTSHEFQS